MWTLGSYTGCVVSVWTRNAECGTFQKIVTLQWSSASRSREWLTLMKPASAKECVCEKINFVLISCWNIVKSIGLGLTVFPCRMCYMNAKGSCIYSPLRARTLRQLLLIHTRMSTRLHELKLGFLFTCLLVYKKSNLIDYTGQHTKCIRNQNSWFLFNSMCWIQIWP
jgi:hypothetical protein